MLGAKANRAAKQTSPEVQALGLFAFAQQVRILKCPVRRWQLVRAVPPVSILTVVVNELDGGVKAHRGDECMQGKHLPPPTTFLKALYIQQPDLTHLTVSLCGYGFRVLPKRKPRKRGFVKMGDRKLVEQPTAILLMTRITNKDRGPYRLIRRHDHRSDLFSKQLPEFLN
jgi:hypothetical protein